MLTSSIKTFRNLFLRFLKTLAMVHEKVLMAFFKLKSMTLDSYSPNLVITIIFLMFLGAMGICQNPD